MKNKKLLFALSWLFTVMISLSGFSQSQVQIGSGTATSQRIPIEPAYDYTYSQVIYLQSEISTAGDITDLKWHFAGSSLSNSNNWDIYIGHTTKTAFASTSDWIDVSTLTQVWSGTFADPGVAGWITFDITDFTYNNTDNLVIAVDENASNDDSFSDDFYCTSVTSYRALTKYGSSNINPASPPSGSRRKYIANIIIEFGNTACPSPSNLTETNINLTSVDLAWTENGTATTWDIEYGLSGFNQGEGTTLTGVTNNPYSITSGLVEGTTYDWYVRASCGASGESTWIGPSTFSTTCSAVAAFPWTEDFENNGNIPQCWSQEYVSGNHDWIFHEGGYNNGHPSSAHGGNYNACFDYRSSGTKTKLIGPQFDLSGLTNPQLTFWHTQAVYEGDQDELRVFYKTSESGSWNMIAEYTSSITSWTQEVLNLPNSSATYYIAFEGLDDFGYGVCVDDVEVSGSSCPAPSSLFADNITQESVNLNWNTGGAALWNIEWGATGFTLGTGTAINGTTNNPQSLSGLTAGATYDFYVQDDCGGGSESSWSSPASFTTLCNAIAAFPYTQDFENAGLRPDCWTEEYNSGSHDWVFQEGGDIDPENAHGGSYNAAFIHQNTSSSTKLISPEFDLSALSNPQISFYHAQLEDVDDQDELRVYYKTSQSGSWNLIPGAEYTSEVSDWTQVTLSLPSANATYFIAFEGTDGYGQGVCIDDIVVDGSVNCLPPSDLYADNITATTAKLNWITGGATTWNIEWGAKGFTQGDGTMISSSTTNPQDISGLAANSIYDFYVQDNCGSTVSTWAGSCTFCSTINDFPWHENFEYSGNRPDCWTEEYVNGNKNWVFTTGGESDQPATAHGGTYNAAFDQGNVGNETMIITPVLDISNVNNPELKFWHTQAAWNGNQNTLTVYYKTTNNGVWTMIPGGSFSSEITDWTKESLALPSATSTYQIAFKGVDGGGFSVCIDDVCVGEATYTPSNQTETNITTTSAVLNWDENGTATIWDIKWCPHNMGFENAQDISDVSKPYTISNLDENESYDWWVSAQYPVSCSGSSDWEGPSSFSTLCNIETLPYVESFEDMLNVGENIYPICMTATHDPGFEDTDWATANEEYSHHREPHTGTQYIYTEDMAHDWLFTQPINLVAGTSYDFSLWYITGGYSGWSDIVILYGTEQTIDAMTDDTIAHIENFRNNVYEKLSGNFSPPTTDTYYIGIYIHADTYTTYLTIDDLKLQETPTCPQPENQTVNNQTQSSVDLNWTEPGNAQIWDIEYGPTGFQLGAGTRYSSITAKPYSLDGLNSSTCYDWYIRTDCTGGDFSDWEGPYTFCTSITSFPYTESFEDGVPPDCWNFTEVSYDGSGAHPEWDDCSSTFFTYSDPPDGSKMAYFNSYQCSSGDKARLESPSFDFCYASNMVLSFWMYHDDSYSSNHDKIQVQIKTGDTWENLETEILRYSTADNWSKHTYDLSAYDGTAVSIGFLAISGLGSYMHIDKVTVHNSAPETSFWSGATDNNWYDVSNWNTSDIPYSTTNVTIPTGLANYPTILSRGAKCDNIRLASDASGDATLLDNTYLSVSGFAVVDRYIPKYVGNAGWHLLSSPVDSEDIQSGFVDDPPAANDDFFYFDETTNYWVNSKNDAGAWSNTFDTQFVVGKGYLIACSNNEDKMYLGNFNTAAVSPTVTYTAGQGEGWNLVGNPYPSAIDWDDASWTKTNISGSVYVYDGAAGQYISWNGTTGSLTDGVIPQMNGFFVEATGSSPALTIPLSARLHGGTPFYKNEKSFLKDHLIMEVTGNGFSDRTYIHFRNDATNSWDKDLDAYKLTGIEEAPQLYSFIDNISASINSNPFNEQQEEVYLGMETNTNGNYTLSAKGIETFNSDVEITLIDLKDETTQDLRTNPSYQFYASSQDITKRFELVFNHLSFDIDDYKNQDDIRIYAIRQQIFIEFNIPKTATVELFNLNGQLLFSGKYNPSNIITINTQHRGFLILRLRTKDGLMSEKVVVF